LLLGLFLIDWQCGGSAAAAAATAAVSLLLFGVLLQQLYCQSPLLMAGSMSFPGRGCLVVVFAVVNVKFSIRSMLNYAMPPKLCWRQVGVFHCSRSNSQYSGQF
jgi:hypothetical protein